MSLNGIKWTFNGLLLFIYYLPIIFYLNFSFFTFFFISIKQSCFLPSFFHLHSSHFLFFLSLSTKHSLTLKSLLIHSFLTVLLLPFYTKLLFDYFLVEYFNFIKKKIIRYTQIDQNQILQAKVIYQDGKMVSQEIVAPL